MASNISQSPLNHRTHLLFKDLAGNVTPYSATSRTSSPTRSWKSPASTWTSNPTGTAIPRPFTDAPTPADLRTSPLSRVAELFNVNHFLVSQARPYIAPFLQTSDHTHSTSTPHHSPTPRASTFYLPLLRVLALELQHRLRQLDALSLLPLSIRRFVIDETIPGASLTLVPELRGRDIWGLLWERPTRERVDEWILRGERSVWPAVAALRVRCAVEVELDRCYQVIRRRKPLDALRSADYGGGGGAKRPWSAGGADDGDAGGWARQGGLFGAGRDSPAAAAGAFQSGGRGSGMLRVDTSAAARKAPRLKGVGKKRKRRRRSNSSLEGGLDDVTGV